MTDTTAVLWAKVEGATGPVHAWLDDQPTDRPWVSLCRLSAQRNDLLENGDVPSRCGNCRLYVAGLDAAERHGERHGDLMWRPS